MAQPVIIITGVSRGLGAIAARRAAGRGADVSQPEDCKHATEEPEITMLAFRPRVVDTEMQVEIHLDDAGRMSGKEYARFLQYHANGQLLPLEVSDHSLAWLALNAPHEWGGEFIPWDDPRLAKANAIQRQD